MCWSGREASTVDSARREGPWLPRWPGGPEGPLVALKIKGAVAALPAVHGVMGLVQQPDARRLRPLVVGIDVAGRQLDPPVTRVAAMKLFGAFGFDQHHPVAVHQGRMVDVSRVVFAEDPGLKAEGALQPRKCSPDFAIGDSRVHLCQSMVLPSDPCFPAQPGAGSQDR